MEYGAHTSHIEWTLRDASAPVDLTLKAYVNDRDYHALTTAYDVANVAHIDGELVTVRLGGGTPWYLRAPDAQFEEGTQWYYGFRYDAEAQRGLDDREDLYHAVTIRAHLPPGGTLRISASLDSSLPAARNPHLRESELLSAGAKPIRKSLTRRNGSSGSFSRPTRSSSRARSTVCRDRPSSPGTTGSAIGDAIR